MVAAQVASSRAHFGRAVIVTGSVTRRRDSRDPIQAAAPASGATKSITASSLDAGRAQVPQRRHGHGLAVAWSARTARPRRAAASAIALWRSSSRSSRASPGPAGALTAGGRGRRGHGGHDRACARTALYPRSSGVSPGPARRRGRSARPACRGRRSCPGPSARPGRRRRRHPRPGACSPRRWRAAPGPAAGARNATRCSGSRPGGRLVEQQQFRLVDDGLRDAGPAQHAAGQGAQPGLSSVSLSSTRSIAVATAGPDRAGGTSFSSAKYSTNSRHGEPRVVAQGAAAGSRACAGSRGAGRSCPGRGRAAAGWPEVGGTAVAIIRSSEVLPAPFGPSRPNTPGPARRSTPATAVTEPKRRVRPVISTFIALLLVRGRLKAARRRCPGSSYHGARSAVLPRGQLARARSGVIPGYDHRRRDEPAARGRLRWEREAAARDRVGGLARASSRWWLAGSELPPRRGAGARGRSAGRRMPRWPWPRWRCASST